MLHQRVRMEAGRVGEGQAENLPQKGRRGDAAAPPVGRRSRYRLTGEKNRKGLTRGGPLMEAATVRKRFSYRDSRLNAELSYKGACFPPDRRRRPRPDPDRGRRH